MLLFSLPQFQLFVQVDFSQFERDQLKQFELNNIKFYVKKIRFCQSKEKIIILSRTVPAALPFLPIVTQSPSPWHSRPSPSQTLPQGQWGTRVKLRVRVTMGRDDLKSVTGRNYGFYCYQPGFDGKKSEICNSPFFFKITISIIITFKKNKSFCFLMLYNVY